MRYHTLLGAARQCLPAKLWRDYGKNADERCQPVHFAIFLITGILFQQDVKQGP